MWSCASCSAISAASSSAAAAASSSLMISCQATPLHGWKAHWGADGRRVYVHESGATQVVKPYEVAQEEEVEEAAQAATHPKWPWQTCSEAAVKQATSGVVDRLVMLVCAKELEDKGMALHGRGNYLEALDHFIEQVLFEVHRNAT